MTAPARPIDLPWADDAPSRELVARLGPMTLGEIGDHFGLSRERIRQIEERAIARFVIRLEAEDAWPGEPSLERVEERIAAVHDALSRAVSMRGAEDDTQETRP